NEFSAQSYRIIHFVVDMPVRIPRKILDRAPPSAGQFGQIIFVICEFQLVDRDTEAQNEVGDASHAKYKERQKKAVMRRLQLGVREMKTPPSATMQAAAPARTSDRPPTSEPPPSPKPTRNA